MGTILVSEFTTLDGSIAAPLFTVDFGFTPAMGEVMAGLTGRSTALLFGRTTWVESGPAWSGRDMADDPGAPFFNDTPKHVVSASLDDVSSWRSSTLLGGYSRTVIEDLKARTDGVIYCYGSGTLVRAMLADGLVDELHLWLYPVATGSGPKLFPEGSEHARMGLVASEAFENGVVHLAYAPTDAGTVASG